MNPLLEQTRRHFFHDCGLGLGSLALTALFQDVKLGAATVPPLVNPLAPPAHAPSRQGQERHLPVHGRRAEPARTVRLQAEAATSCTASRFPESFIKGKRFAFMTRSPRSRPSCSARGASSPGTASAAPGSPNCCRTSATIADDIAIVRSHGDRRLQSRPGQAVRQHRLAAVRPAEHGRVGHVRHRQRVAGPARLRRAAIRPARPARRRRRCGAAASCRRPTRACRSAPAASRS